MRLNVLSFRKTIKWSLSETTHVNSTFDMGPMLTEGSQGVNAPQTGKYKVLTGGRVDSVVEMYAPGGCPAGCDSEEPQNYMFFSAKSIEGEERRQGKPGLQFEKHRSTYISA